VFFGGTAFADNTKEGTLEPYKKHIKLLISLELYPEAENAIDSLFFQQNHPEWGHLFRATLLLTQQIDFGDSLGTQQLFSDLDSAEHHFFEEFPKIDISDSLKKSNNLLGTATVAALRAQYLNEVAGSPIKAYKFIKEAKRNFQQSLAYNPGNVDALTALAVFDFWQSHVLRYLTWLPILADNRQESLEVLRELTKEGKEADISSTVSLVWILIENNNNAEALRIGEKLISTFGPLRSVHEPCGKAAFMLKNYGKTQAHYIALIKSLEDQERTNKTRIIGALNRLAIIADSEKDYTAVVSYADKALSFDLNEAQAKKKAEDLERLISYRKEALDLLEN